LKKSLDTKTLAFTKSSIWNFHQRLENIIFTDLSGSL